MPRRRGPAGFVLASCLALVALSGCTRGQGGAGSSPGTSASSTPSAGPAGSSASPEAPWTPGPSDVDLPAPSPPTSAAPSRAGSLSLASVPVPSGWKAVPAKGGVEEGFLGNGTPAHARDPRYAAYEIMSVGCAAVDRSRWSDPTSALEVKLARGSATGVAEVMVFPTAADATSWFALWKAQVAACQHGTNPRTTSAGDEPDAWLGRRDYGGGEVYGEVAALTGSTVRLYLLADPGSTITTAQQQALLTQLRSSR